MNLFKIIAGRNLNKSLTTCLRYSVRVRKAFKGGTLKRKCTADALRGAQQTAVVPTTIIIDGLDSRDVSHELQLITCNTRHYGISLIISETFLSLCPAIRTNIDYTIWWPTHRSDLVYKYYFGGVEPDVFQQIAKKIAIAHNGAMVSDYKGRLMWYKTGAKTNAEVEVKTNAEADGLVLKVTRSSEAVDVTVAEAESVFREKLVSISRQLKVLQNEINMLLGQGLDGNL
jgi:hypothetical protein